jgi:hypothetical protein
MGLPVLSIPIGRVWTRGNSHKQLKTEIFLGVYMFKYLRCKVRLEGIEPEIWRTFLVDASANCYLLHEVLVDVIGWEGDHLYLFKKGKRIITEPENDQDGDLRMEDALLVPIREILKDPGDKVNYVYDMGDEWFHTIELLGYEERKESFLGHCLAGERACPPENCGGVIGYRKILEALKSPDSKEFKNFMDWYGYPFDPEQFQVDAVNRDLEDIAMEMEEEGYWKRRASTQAFHIANSLTEKDDGPLVSDKEEDDAIAEYKRRGWQVFSSQDEKE